MLTLPFLYLPSGHVNFTISTEIVDSNELCGGRKGVVPNRGRSDTLIKPVLVKVRVFQDGCQRRRPQPHRMLSAPPCQSVSQPSLSPSILEVSVFSSVGPSVLADCLIHVVYGSAQCDARLNANTQMIRIPDLISCFSNSLQTLSLALLLKNFP